MTYPVSYFFNLIHYSHASLFSKLIYPWEALNHLKEYFFTLLLGIHLGNISPQAYLVNPELISIGKESFVEPGAFIQGPCVIGERCTIRHGACIRGEVLIGDDCVVGHDTEVKSSIFFDHAHAAHFAYVGNSILGKGVNLGAGTKCANFRLDHQSIHVHYFQEKINTNRAKLGALIGDYSQIGCNAVLNPGSLIGQNVLCHPCLNVGGFVPSDSQVISPSNPVIKKR